MTDTLKEQVSALLDGELPEAETTLLLKRLGRDEELKAVMSRYSLIGAVLRVEGAVPDASHVAARVRAALAHEPAWPPGRPAPGRSGSSRTLAGLAVAAGVAAATLMLGPFLYRGAAGPDEPFAKVVAPEAGVVAAGAQADIVPVVAQVEEPAVTYTTPPAPAGPAGALPSAQLASYLVAHSEYTSPLARRSVLTAVHGGQPGEEPQEAAGQ